MSTNPVLIDEPGKKVLLMGNEAIARGAIEAGASVATAYPGTPSSEIGNTLSRVSEATGIYFEWSVNEKVAFEVAFGSSMCGQRSLGVALGSGLGGYLLLESGYSALGLVLGSIGVTAAAIHLRFTVDPTRA